MGQVESGQLLVSMGVLTTLQRVAQVPQGGLQMLTSEGVGEGVVGVRGKVVGGGGVGVVRVADDHQRRGRCWSRVGSRCWCGWEAWCRGMKGWLQMLVKVAGKVG